MNFSKTILTLVRRINLNDTILDEDLATRIVKIKNLNFYNSLNFRTSVVLYTAEIDQTVIDAIRHSKALRDQRFSVKKKKNRFGPQDD